MLPKNPSLFAFDKDGTIIDVHHYWVSMTNLRVKLLKNYHQNLSSTAERDLLTGLGVNLKKNQMFSDGPTGVKPRTFNQSIAENILRAHGISKNFMVEDAFSEADEISRLKIKSFVKPIPGALELINIVHSMNINIAVISNDIHSRVQLAMESLNIIDKISLIVGGDEVKNVKPSSDMLIKAMKYFRCNSLDVVNIGDHPNDMQMGLNANVSCNIGVLTGLNSEKEFQSFNCQLVNSLFEVKMKYI